MEIKISNKNSITSKSLDISLYPADFSEMMFAGFSNLLTLRIAFSGDAESGRFTAKLKFPAYLDDQLLVFHLTDIADFRKEMEECDGHEASEIFYMLQEEIGAGLWEEDYYFCFGEQEISELIKNGGYFRIVPKMNSSSAKVLNVEQLSRLRLLSLTVVLAGDWSPKSNFKQYGLSRTK